MTGICAAEQVFVSYLLDRVADRWEINMKYAVILCDGMSDYKLPELNNKTPLEASKKPNMDYMAKNGEIGLLKTVADGLSPGSDVANLSVLGYDPFKFYDGRSPIEAASIGIDFSKDDVATRCNFVTLSDEAKYHEKTMVDYCADDISTKEADELIKYINCKLGNEIFSFYTGVSYRHCLIWKNGPDKIGKLTPPHDITGKKISDHLPQCPEFLSLMERSYELLKNHPVNIERIKNGLRPANSIWLWGSGRKKELTQFYAKFNLRGSVISAVDLVKGIGKLAGMNVVDVEGATGYIDTNFSGKAAAALKEFENGQDFVYIHIEAPDECGHRHEIENKVKAIELIDELVIAPVLDGLKKMGDFRVMILPDHATPLMLRTHVSDPVPYILYDSREKDKSGCESFCEQSAKDSSVYYDIGYKHIERLLEKK